MMEEKNHPHITLTPPAQHHPSASSQPAISGLGIHTKVNSDGEYGNSAGYPPAAAARGASLDSQRPLTPMTSQEERDRDHFAHAHGGTTHVDGASKPLGWRHLFKRPVIRQWLNGGKLYKGKRERDATYVELFFDLMFVGIIHQLAEGAVEPVAGSSVVLFILTFYPSWSIWSDVRNFVNHSGTDDVLQRLYILINMILLAGYSAMASSIELEQDSTGIEAATTTGTTTTLAAETTVSLVSYHLGEGFHRPLRAAVGFLLTAKLFRLATYAIYAVALPRFRTSLTLSGLQLLLPCAFWLGLVWAEEQTTVVALASTAIGTEMGVRYVVGIIAKLDRQRKVLGGSDWLVPAISIEHMIERTSAFVVLVLGEVIINSTFQVTPDSDQIGVHTEYGRSALSIVIAFEILWLYFDSDSSRAFIHALRRHWITSILSTQLHWPLAAGIVLMSAALQKMVSTAEVEQGLRWYFGGGIATAISCTAALGWLHLSLDAPGGSLLPRSVRLFARVAVAVVFAVVPLSDTFKNNLSTLALHAGLLAILIIFETFGKIGAHPPDHLWSSGPDQKLMTPKGKGGKWGRWGHGIAKDDLTDAETGENDVGVEEDLGEIQTRRIQPHQRLAYTA